MVIFTIISFMKLFATGAMPLGNVMFFFGMLIESGSWHYNSRSIYIVRQAVMLGSLLVARLLGNVLAVASMANTASIFLVIWLMDKERQIPWGSMGIIVVFALYCCILFRIICTLTLNISCLSLTQLVCTTKSVYSKSTLTVQVYRPLGETFLQQFACQ